MSTELRSSLLGILLLLVPVMGKSQEEGKPAAEEEPKAKPAPQVEKPAPKPDPKEVRNLPHKPLTESQKSRAKKNLEKLVLLRKREKVWDCTFKTDDRIQIYATVYLPDTKYEAPPAVLTHQYGGQRWKMQDLALALREKGYAVLCIDLRGHGQSTKDANGKPYTWENFTPVERKLMLFDIKAAKKWLLGLRQVKQTGILLGGARFGANLSVYYSAYDDSVRGLLLISPGRIYEDLKIQEYRDKAFTRPSLVLTSGSDDWSFPYCKALAKQYSSITLVAAPKDKKRNFEGSRLFYLFPKSWNKVDADGKNVTDDEGKPVRTNVIKEMASWTAENFPLKSDHKD